MGNYVITKADRVEFEVLARAEVTTLLRSVLAYIESLEHEVERLRALELEHLRNLQDWMQHGPHLRPLPHISGTQ